MKASDGPIIVKQTFDSSSEKVWNAITDPDEMRQWYFEMIPDFKPEVGFKTQFNVKSGDRNFNHRWRVTEVVPLQKIAYNWSYDAYPGDAYVVFEIDETDSGTTLTLTNVVREDFPDDIPEFKRASCVGGWEYFIKQRLKAYLDNI